MGESTLSLIAERSGEGKTSKIPIRVNIGEHIAKGGGDREVHKVTIVVGKKEMPAVLKVMSQDEARKEQENYLQCKRAGLDVPDTFRVTERGVVMTDMTEGGKRLVFSLNEINIRDEVEKKRKLDNLIEKRPEWISLIISADFENPSISKQIENIIGVATNSGVMLSADSYFLDFSLNGKLRIRPGDFGGVKQKVRGGSKDDVRNFNQIMADSFIEKLKQFQAALRERN